MNKNMHKPIRYPINVIRVFDAFWNYPHETMTVRDLLNSIGLRKKTNERMIRKAIKWLKKRKLLKEIRPWGTPPKAEDILAKYDKSYHYALSKTGSAFRQGLDLCMKTDIPKFLASNYTKNVISEIGFEEVYQKIEPYLSDPQWRKLASFSLLRNPATREEYTRLAKHLLEKIIESNCKMDHTTESEDERIEISNYLTELREGIVSAPIRQIEILAGFETLESVRFYRENIHKNLLNAYDELAKRGVITKGLCDFLAFDNYLSPLTAHPLNSMNKVLFSKPFERIYEDAYLLDTHLRDYDFGALSARTVAIYNNFADFLFEYFSIDPPESEAVDIISREMIYAWNVASTRFDLVWYYLEELHEKEIGSGNYHLRSDGISYQVTDLESGLPLLNENVSSSLLIYGSIPRIIEEDQQNSSRLKLEVMKEPFSYLRPCLTFKDMDLRSRLIPIEEILTELDEKLKPSDA